MSCLPLPYLEKSDSLPSRGPFVGLPSLSSELALRFRDRSEEGPAESDIKASRGIGISLPVDWASGGGGVGGLYGTYDFVRSTVKSVSINVFVAEGDGPRCQADGAMESQMGRTFF